MPAKTIYPFLEALTQNNSKAWMDTNRAWYQEAKEAVVELCDPILLELKSIDPRIVQESARKSINRINNNLMFHPDRPTYKDHFGIVFGYGKGLADFYLELGVEGNLIAGGLWHPTTEELKKIRSEIHFEGDRLQKVVTSKTFTDQFELYTEDALKTTPRGYDKEHPFIELMRLKSVAAYRNLPRKTALSLDFQQTVVASFQTLLPMIDFLNVAIKD